MILLQYLLAAVTEGRICVMTLNSTGRTSAGDEINPEEFLKMTQQVRKLLQKHKKECVFIS